MYRDLEKNVKAVTHGPHGLRIKHYLFLTAALLVAGAGAAAPARADATVRVSAIANVQDPEFDESCPADPITDLVTLETSQPSFQRKYTSECGRYRAVLLLDGAWQPNGTFKLTAHSFADKNYCEGVFECGWHICSPGPEHVVERSYGDGAEGELKDSVLLKDVEEDWDVAHLDTTLTITVL